MIEEDLLVENEHVERALGMVEIDPRAGLFLYQRSELDVELEGTLREVLVQPPGADREGLELGLGGAASFSRSTRSNIMIVVSLDFTSEKTVYQTLSVDSLSMR